MRRSVKCLISIISSLLLPLQGVEIFAQTAENDALTGQVNVLISPALTMNNPVDFTVELSGEKIKLTLDNDGEEEVSFKGLSKGNYELKVSAEGFADYIQTVRVDEQAANVKLSTDFLEGIDYQQGLPHPGTLLVGDVDGNGVIDDSDRETLVNSIDSDGDIGDLNGDGEINLIDLEYLSKGYKAEGDTQAVSQVIIPSAVIKPSAGEGTEIEGSTDALFEKSGSIKLFNSNGKEISAENPVSLDFEIDDTGNASHADGIVIGVSEDNPVSKAEVDIVYIENGVEYTQKALVENGVHHLLHTDSVIVEQDSHGNIHINLGDQIAVKKVSIIISGMTRSNNLAEISYVEFVNGMENKIPEPDMDIPEHLTAWAGNKEFVLNWDACKNVTGYEVKVELGGVTEVKKVTGNSIKVSAFNGKKLENETTYKVSVQSVNGAWRSGYCDSTDVTPKATSKPGKPDGLTAKGEYCAVILSWKKAEDAETHNIYYKEAGEDAFIKIEGVKATSYTIEGLKELTEYLVYVTGVNDLGEGPSSLTVSAVTTDLNPAVMPKYNLINTGEPGEKGAHIISAWINTNSMVNSPLDDGGNTAWGTVDHDPASYYYRNTWDDGGFNNLGKLGLFYEFDEEYTIKTIAFQEFVPLSLSYFYNKINIWDAEGNLTNLSNKASLSKKTDADGRVYYLITLPQKTQVKKIQIGLARYLASGNINVSEVYFYKFDTIEDEIAALYQDDLHVTLKPEVTQETIDALKTRLNTPDEVSGEYNPDKAIWERELENAEAILNNTSLRPQIEVHNTISTNDVNRGFGGLNAWQPLGVIAAAGESVTVYVGHNTRKTGDNTNLQIVATQYHAESGSVSKVVASLKVGANVVQIPKLWSVNEESGGALYIQYTGNNANDRYAVRVSGGVAVPTLDLYHVEDEAERTERAEKYAEELKAYVEQLESLHSLYHTNSNNTNVNKFEYNQQNCILGATDIMLDTMMLSLPAKRVLDGMGQGSYDDMAARVLSSADAMESMMKLFYQHKGLNENAQDNLDRIPKGHLNIRYQRMFSGAFMYAAGNHIGIEWAQCSGMVSASPLVFDEDGRYVSGKYFGWGIAHEIGHCINQGAYSVAEITNNYYAQLAQAHDSNVGMRFTYKNIYSKVTSNTVGASSNLATQLGMYWQLHLAYDTSYNFMTYEDHSQQLQSFFFARMDTYARKTSLAPAPGGIALTLGDGSDQNLMRLACAAAEKDILDFFVRWGKVPNAATVEYAGQFEKETRAIYYTDDDSRVYRIENPNGGILGTGGDVIAVGEETSAVRDEFNPARVNITLSSQNISENDILGYEIVRCMISGGEVTRETVGFTAENTFSDYISTVNNRVVFYEVTLIDKYLNRSAVKTLESIKIEHDGSLDKSFWTVTSSNITPSEMITSEAEDDMPCAPAPKDSVIYAADAKDTVYIGVVGTDGEITLSFNRFITVSGLRYTAGSENPIGEYRIAVRTESGEWITAAQGVFGESKTVYFENEDEKYVSTYRTDAVKLIIPNQEGNTITVTELDVLGVTGDNVDFVSTNDDQPVIGVLSEAYKYGTESGDVIPEGSIVFTGKYKGNPAYNVVLLYDQDGNIVGGIDADGNLKAQQIILAEVPENGNIQDVSEGTWIYWIELSDGNPLDNISKARAELYRVNNALTNEGQRLVSDSLFADIPSELPNIDFGH